MITNAVDYYKEIVKIKDANKPQYAILLPVDEKIYEIDLNKRTTTAPDFLAVDSDHYAETIYFKVDRFYDNMDLADTVCTIQYINNNDNEDEGHIYLVPFFDILTYRDDNKILFPWQISNIVAKKSGTISFSIRFFKTVTIPGDPTASAEEDRKDKYKLIYNLNIQPAKTKVLLGLNLNLPSPDEYHPDPDLDQHPYDYLMSEVDRLSKMIGLYWIDNLEAYLNKPE